LPSAGPTAHAAGHSRALPARSATETPFFFAVQGVPLYAVLHDAAAERAGAPVVVHVHGLGVEQITLYRQEVLAARAAAALGFPVFRYHARGHGDSACAWARWSRPVRAARARDATMRPGSSSGSR